jgi:DNA processing protein
VEARLLTLLSLLALPAPLRTAAARWARARGGLGAWLDQDPADLLGLITGSLLPDTGALDRAARTARAQAGAAGDLGLRVLALGGADYPSGLLRLGEPPLLLFVRGPLPTRPPVAVVGTRAPSPWGLDMAAACGRGEPERDPPLLNGLAAGVDRAAAEAALETGRPCVGVLAAGHDAPDYARPGCLARRVSDAGGCLVSEYPPGSAAHKGSFIARDRIQAGLSAAVLVVESGPEGGTLHTARAAAGAGVPLYALLPGERLEQAQGDPAGLPRNFQGAWGLIRGGEAQRVDSPAAWRGVTAGLAQEP